MYNVYIGPKQHVQSWVLARYIEKRAKYRVGVIGGYSLWRSIPHVRVVCDALKDAIVSGKQCDKPL